uniref:NADH-ubiquinone oxidoreductase chain 6 n=1 Tax=Drilus flavescens TaxID=295522 RepID=E3VT96_9COLE|nr:NADH dehydrogenase subunit 6 [Drilus flavescens]
MVTILTTLMITSTIFIWTNHPMSAGMTLMAHALLIALMSGTMSNNLWYSYILFIIMIGGLLVLFIYMTSVASNEKFKISFSIMFMIVAATMWTTKNQEFLHMSNKTMEMLSFNSNWINQMSMSKYLNNPLNLWVISMIVYLLLALIAVAKITNIKYGPLRSKT